MPYISDSLKQREGTDKVSLKFAVEDLIDDIKCQYSEEEYEGVCNYVISRVVAGVMRPQKGWRYKWLNRAHGTFLSAAAEFYRRMVAPYEDVCILKNGDIEEYKSCNR
jgi:hypothetical protein